MTEKPENENIAAEIADQYLETAISKGVEAAAAIDDPNGPIRLDCDVAGHKGEFVLFHRRGWKMRHLCDYEEAIGTKATIEIIAKRIVDWTLTDGEGSQVPFEPKDLRKKAEELPADRVNEKAILDLKLQGSLSQTFRELPPDIGKFLIMAYRLAYTIAGSLPPK